MTNPEYTPVATELLNDPQYIRQLRLEEEMVDMGVKRFHDRNREAHERGEESGTAAGQALLKAAVAPMLEALKAFLETAASGKAGRRHAAVKYLKQIAPEVVCYLTARSVLNSITSVVPVQQVAERIATAIEDEVRFRTFHEATKSSPKSNRSLYQYILKDLRKRTANPKHIRTVLIHSMNKAEVGWENWAKVDKMHLGMKCLDLLVESTGLVQMAYNRRGSYKRTEAVLEPTEATLQWIEGKNLACEALAPVWMPTIIKPRDWTSPFDGGYHSRMARELTLVKTSNQNYLEELRNTEMPMVYDAINALQKTGWRINKGTLEVLEYAWQASLTHGSLPPSQDIPIPQKPGDIDTNPESLKRWKVAAAKVHTENRQLRSKRVQIALALGAAQRFKDEPAIYFPYQMDFRGRLYAVTSALSPQGADYAKSLLEFSEGKPIRDIRAAMWLAVHGANLFGFDKTSLDERSMWVEEHEDVIFAVAADPMSNLWWTEADKPWQFLAFCMEWAAFRKRGFGYVSHLPVSMDGTCNGLQHFSAMLRDPVGGAAVNLLPSKTPADIYEEVAKVVRARLLDEAQTEPTGGEPCADISKEAKQSLYASKWSDFGIDRKTCKRPVMTLPYGSTLYSCRQFVEDWHDEKVKDTAGLESPFEKGELMSATKYLAEIIWDSIGQVVVAAREAMGWLQEAATVAAREGLPVCWTTPAGFPVQQFYREPVGVRITTKLGDKARVRLTVVTAPGEIDKRRSASGISPNFVHSLDAAALMLCVVKAARSRIQSFAMVHDSYGTHAADADEMARCLRESFVEMYQRQDVLADFRDEISGVLSEGVELPELPPQGSLDISEVLDSEFFFA
jgi:DNA-directed RNA polymerase